VPADTAKLIITAGTPSSAGGDSTNNVVGIALNHAYTIVGAYILKNADGTQKARLLRIRNPWGSDGAYNGTWRDSDPVWATAGQTYKTQVPYISANDGFFFVTVEDFVKYYQAFVITHYHDGWQHSTSTVYDDNGLWKRFDFTIPVAQEGFIGLEFYAPRMYSKGCKTAYTTGSLRVFSNGKLIDSKVVYDIDDFGFIYNSSLKAGNYTVFAKPTWKTNDVKDYTVRIYMKSLVTIKRTDYTVDTAAAADMGKMNQASKFPLFCLNYIFYS
jgi:hypothetical protein